MSQQGSERYAIPPGAKSPSGHRWSREWLTGLLRLGVGLGLLSFLFRSMDLGTAMELIRSMRPVWLGFAALLILSIRFVFAWRWRILLADQGLHLSVGSLSRVIFISMFFGSFLPGVFGSDLVRGYRVARTHGRAGVVAGTLLVDRLLGVYALGVVALIAAIAGEWAGNSSHGMLVPLILLQVFAALVGATGLALVPRLRRIRLGRDSQVGLLLRRLLDAVARAIEPAVLRKVVIPVMFLSLGVVVLRCLIFFSLYRALGVDPGLAVTFLFVPLVFVAVLVPVSIGGIGVREVALVYFFATVGMPTEVSVSVGLLFHGLQILCSVPGVALWLAERRAPAEPPSARATSGASD